MEPIYIARAHVEKIAGTRRRLTLENGVDFEVGVHGPIKTHFKLDKEPDLPLPVDYIAAATGG